MLKVGYPREISEKKTLRPPSGFPVAWNLVNIFFWAAATRVNSTYGGVTAR